MFAGKFIKKKRPLDFVQAIAQQASGIDSIQGLMVGDGPLRAHCEQIIAHLKVPIRFTGFLNQSAIAGAYAAADALVLPSDGGETWGLVVNEAMACGLPCIVSDKVGCGPDLIAGNETGIVYPVGDVNVLATSMGNMAANLSNLRAMGLRARRRVQEHSVSAAVSGVLECLAAVSPCGVIR